MTARSNRGVALGEKRTCANCALVGAWLEGRDICGNCHWQLHGIRPELTVARRKMYTRLHKMRKSLRNMTAKVERYRARLELLQAEYDREGQ